MTTDPLEEIITEADQDVAADIVRYLGENVHATRLIEVSTGNGQLLLGALGEALGLGREERVKLLVQTMFSLGFQVGRAHGQRGYPLT